MAKKETAAIVGGLLAVGSLGLLAAVMAEGKKNYAPGQVVASGEKRAGSNNMLYEWQIVGSVPGDEFPLVGRAKLAGFGEWNAETILAKGPDLELTQQNLFEALATLT